MSLKFKSYSKHAPMIRSSSSIITAGAVDHVRKEKRLQSTDPEMTEVPRSDAPKTLEYAYFKKFKKDLGGVNSRSLDKRNDRLNSGNINGQESESSITANRFEDLRRKIRSSIEAELQVPAHQSLFLSPSCIDNNDYMVENRKDELCEIKHDSSRPSGNPLEGSQDEFPSPFAHAAIKISGKEYAEDGVFSIKRNKLRQLVADSFKDIEGFNVNSKGFDLISMLLNRLFPRGDETKCCGQSKFKEELIDPDHHAPAFPEPDTRERSRTPYAGISYCGSLWNDAVRWSGRPKHGVLAEWDTIASGFCQTKYDLKTNLQNKEGNRFHGFDNGNTVGLLCSDSESYFMQSFENLHPGGFHLRELDEFHDPDAPSKKEPYSLLLSLDDQEDKENSYTFLTNVGYRHIVHDTLDAVNLPQLSLSGHSVDLHSFLDFRLTDAFMHEPQRSHEDDYALQVAEQYPPELPSPPRYLTMKEDFDTVDHLNNSITDLSHIDLTRCSTLVSDKERVFDAVLFSRGLHFDLGWECLPIIDLFSDYSSNHRIYHFPWKEDLTSFASENKERRLYGSEYQQACLPLSYKNAFETSGWSSANIDASIGKVIGNSLLLDYPGRVSYEEESYLHDDNE